MKDGMEDNGNPILFNAIKHHRGYILGFILLAKSNKYPKETIRKSLLKVGRLMIDVYHGDLTVLQIEYEVGLILRRLNAYDKEDYDAYIDQTKKNYRTVTLSDGSNWTLLKGRHEGRHIHIHPSRYAKNTTRIKATALKTAIFLRIFYEQPIPNEQLVSLTNEIREKYLNESPIKNEIYTAGLQRVLAIL